MQTESGPAELTTETIIDDDNALEQLVASIRRQEVGIQTVYALCVQLNERLRLALDHGVTNEERELVRAMRARAREIVPRPGRSVVLSFEEFDDLTRVASKLAFGAS